MALSPWSLARSRRRRHLDAGGLGLLAEHRHAALHVVAVRRELVHPPGAGQFRGANADPVHLDVIGMPVVAEVVIDRQHVGVFFAQDRGQPLGGLLDRGGPEGAGQLVGRLAHHPGIDIPEELGPGGPENRCSGMGFDDPALPQFLTVGEESVVDLAVLAAGGHHQHHPVPARPRPCA